MSAFIDVEKINIDISASAIRNSDMNFAYDAYAQFMDNYPNSDFIKDLDNTYNKTNQTLIELKDNQDEI